MKVLRIALALAIVAISSLAAQAKVEPTTAYMFGFASSFNDSTVYITSVQKVDSVYLSHKNLFWKAETTTLSSFAITWSQSANLREPAS